MADPGEQSDDPAARPMSIVRARALVAAVEQRADLAQGAAQPSRAELDDLITAASGLRLTLEAERLRTRREADELLAEEGERRLESIEDMREREAQLMTEIERLKALLEELRPLGARLSGAPGEGRPAR